ncbi:MAG: hypothetical protein ABWZ76_13090 [Acidimicrobiales bacterium]
MASITDLLRSLGTEGALANAEATLVEREREDWIIASLRLRLAQPPVAPRTPAAAPAREAVSV